MTSHSVESRHRSTALRLTIVALLVLVNPSVTAQPPQVMNPLRAFEFLAGSCWEGRFPNRAATDEHCFEWLHEGKFLRDRHTVRGDPTPYSGETTYVWDANAGHIAYWYIASNGSFSTGSAEASGDSILFPESYVSSSGAVMEILSTWTRTGRDSYHIRVTRKSDTGEEELWSMEMKRKSHPVRAPDGGTIEEVERS